MQAQRIRAVGRSRCEYTCKRAVLFRAWVDFEYIAPRFMQPGDYDNFIADFEVVDPLHCEPIYFQPCVGGAFGSLFWRVRSRFDGRSDCANRPEGAQLVTTNS
jgi:hypothetical protein